MNDMQASMITANIFKNIQYIRHGFLTRKGGVSSDIWSSANMGLGSQDDRCNVIENRKRASMIFQAPIVGVYQVHSNNVVLVTSDMVPEQGNIIQTHCDGMVCKDASIALGILTADCVPILLCDGKQKIIGAVHAGWRGALNGVVESCIDLMVAQGSIRGDIIAAIGPHIAQKSYQVGQDLLASFMQQSPSNKEFFVPDEHNKYLFNICSYLMHRLQKAGIEAIEAIACDTYEDEERFFSFRRSTKRSEDDYGRQISIICLNSDHSI